MFPLFGILNELDCLLIIVLFLGGLVGMSRGAIPQIISAISIWLGMVIALWLYNPLSRNIIKGFFQSWSFEVSDALAFFILFGLFFHGIRLILTYLLYPPENEEAKKKAEQKRKKKREREGLDEPAFQRFVVGPLNLFGGLILGMVLTVFWWSIILGMLQFILQPRLLVGVSGILENLALAMRSSWLIQTIFNPVLYYFSVSVQLFIPQNATILQDIVNIVLFTRG